MGCAGSKVETEDVKRCKARKQLLKQAVAHRHAFAAAHASYVQSLKSTGAAIRQFADVDQVLPHPNEQVPLLPLPHQSTTTAKPPPPLPPDKPRLQGGSTQDPFSGPYSPLPRAHSMPPLVINSLGGAPSKVFHPQAVDEDEEEFDEAQGYSQHKPTQSEPLFHIFDSIRVPETSTSDIEDFEGERAAAEGTRDDVDDEVGLQHEAVYQGPVHVLEVEKVVEEKGASERERRKQSQMATPQRLGKTDKDLGTLLHLLDDLFLKSYEAGRPVSLLLEAPREYHHEPFVDEKYGIKEHNKKVSHILTWTRSSTGAYLADDRSPNSNINLASTLDKLHAWEKKLYDEIKALETTRLELNRRTGQLKHQKVRRETAATIEKTKALVKSLHTKHLVEFQAVDAALLEVTKLRDDNLHPQLKNILKALSDMWESMLYYHHEQIPLMEELKVLEATPSIKETSDICKEITDDLEREVTLWHDSLEKVVTFQGKCVTALLDWLHLNAKQMESEAVESLEPPQKAAGIPLLILCQKWVDALKQISAEQVLISLKRFSNILHDMATKQENEIKQKKRKEDIQKEWERKKKALEAFESKYKEKSTASDEMQESRHPVQERRALVDLLEKNLEEERQRHAKMCEENSTMMLQSLKCGLPGVLHSILEFSQACVEMYRDLVKLDLPQH